VSTKREQGFIRHVALVIDESASIDELGLTDTVIKVVDGQVSRLAERNENADSENRVTIYTFNGPGLRLPYGHPDGNVRCQFYDRGDLRHLSLKGRYKPAGGTPLIDAVFTAIEELKLTAQIHGEHRFLVYAVTDGYENVSKHTSRELSRLIESLEDNWTVACFVPNHQGVEEAIDHGFPAGNVQRWDATSAEGVEEVGQIMAATTDAWMTSHTTGVKGTRSLFVGAQVDAAQVKSKLTPLAHTAYDIVPVTKTADAWLKRKRPTKKFPEGEEIGWVVRIDDFLNKVAPPFEIGKGYYQLFSHGARRSEKIQGNKPIAVMDKQTSQVYVGHEARQIVGLPAHDVTVKPDANPDYEIFVKSSSDNRQLPVGTKLLIMKK
jgi:hypothetical protein